LRLGATPRTRSTRADTLFRRLRDADALDQGAAMDAPASVKRQNSPIDHAHSRNPRQ
jgi:hypothetical protein